MRLGLLGLIFLLGNAHLEILDEGLVTVAETACNFTFADIITSIGGNSGNFINKLGHYDSCVKQGHSKYFLSTTFDLQVFLKKTYVGLCVPETCNATDIQQTMKDIYNVSNVSFSGVVIEEPLAFEKTFDFDLGSYAWFIFTGVLTIFAVVSTIIHQYTTHLKRIQKQMDSDKHAHDKHTHEEKKQLAQPTYFAMWDLVSNFKSIIYSRRVNSSVQVFELFRVMGFLWVVMGHEFGYRLPSSQNYIDSGFLSYTKNSWPFTVTENGFYAVDIFLFIGGYVSILTISKYVNSFNKMNWVGAPIIFFYSIFKRYMRIMPTYAFMLLFWWKVAPHLSYGPLVQDFLQCTSQNFWESWILGWHSGMVDNTLCAGWCWYLAVDFQLFCTIPIICLIVKKNKMMGIIICSALVFICTAATIFVCWWYKLQWMNYDNADMYIHYYPKSYLRGNVYYLGCLFCYATMPGGKKGGQKGGKKGGKKGDVERDGGAPIPDLTEEEKQKEQEHKDRKKQKVKKFFKMVHNVMGWSGFLMITGNAILMHYVFQWGRNVKGAGLFFNNMFITFGKIVFVISFLLFLMAISFTYKSFSKFIATNRLIQLIGNLGFSGYLFHFTMIMIRLHSTQELPTYSFYDLFAHFCMDLSCTIVIATIATLLVELPAQHLWKTRVDSRVDHLLKNLMKKIEHATHSKAHSRAHSRKNSRMHSFRDKQETQEPIILGKKKIDE